MHYEMQQAIGPILNRAVGIAVVAAGVLFLGCLAIELTKRPRYSLRTLLITMTALAMLLGLGSISRW
jgi:hypothetical protein